MSATWPLEMHSTFIFAEHEGRTKFTVRWAPINATEAELKMFAEGMVEMKQGWTGTLEQLNDYLTTIAVLAHTDKRK